MKKWLESCSAEGGKPNFFVIILLLSDYFAENSFLKHY
jgi:hypothetical protein